MTTAGAAGSSSSLALPGSIGYLPDGAAAASPGIPLAFTAYDDGATASPSQAATLANLQDQFKNEVGQTHNPNDPAYAEKWMNAEEESDANFRRLLGWQAYVQAQLAQLHGGGSN